MKLTLRELKAQIENVKEELLDKPVYIEAPNSLLLDAKIKFSLKEPSLEITKENVSHVLITYDD
ncbi:MAG: hypothetical protein PF487_08930 [Bacteroidales bacterium]|jgi:hypothetical protein|nr:hypothetical protein [Bacteroidales bacterium]